jgi:cyanophycin synthetase
MRILEIKVLRGPNYWSSYRKQLIQMKLDLEEYEQYPTNTLEGFSDRIEKLMPSLVEHECSENKRGGFFERVREGTWLGHVAEHIALELQTLAGMRCGYGRTRSTEVKGVYHVVIAYTVANAGIYAAKAGVRIVDALARNIPYDISEDVKELSRIRNREGLGPSSQAIVDEAMKRDIPWRRLDNNSTILLGHGKHQRIVRATVTGGTGTIGVDIAADKAETKALLRKERIPVPPGEAISSEEELREVIKRIGFPIVIKPLSGNHGRGITTNITDWEEALKAMALAQRISTRVIVERFIHGADYRLLVINNKLVAASKRIPAMIMGDGVSTIEELVEKTNRDPNRGEGHEKNLTVIKLDAATRAILSQKNLALDSVLPAGEMLFLKDTANISTGGTSRDVTHIVHPRNVFLAERIARLIGLDVCGIDIVATDINVPITGENGAVLEVNAAPGLRMHLAPSKGMAHNVAEPLVKMLFPKGTPSRIPIVAVTGTNGKTTTTRLIAHIARQAGHMVGYTSTDGIFIGDEQVDDGDCSGPSSAEIVLRDPIVDFAVLECARGGILRSGLGFDKCNTSIITNITDDHLGLDDINSLDELAKVKAVVAQSTDDNGYAILNADDDRVYRIARDLDCNIALFSTSDSNERIKMHCKKGGLAAIIEKGYYTVCNNGWSSRVAKVKDVPLTLDGKATCMVKNILPAILAAVVHDIDLSILRKALQTFIPGPAQTPGRMNIYSFENFRVMVDYAHNRDGFNELKEFLRQTDAAVKVGIITSPGDRRDEDIRNIGEYAAGMFDEIIIRHDKDGRGRSNEDITRLIREGISRVNPGMPLTVVSDEIASIQYAMNTAKENSFIVVCTEDVQAALQYLSAVKQSHGRVLKV